MAMEFPAGHHRPQQPIRILPHYPSQNMIGTKSRHNPSGPDRGSESRVPRRPLQMYRVGIANLYDHTLPLAYAQIKPATLLQSLRCHIRMKVKVRYGLLKPAKDRVGDLQSPLLEEP